MCNFNFQKNLLLADVFIFVLKSAMGKMDRGF